MQEQENYNREKTGPSVCLQEKLKKLLEVWSEEEQKLTVVLAAQSCRVETTSSLTAYEYQVKNVPHARAAKCNSAIKCSTEWRASQTYLRALQMSDITQEYCTAVVVLQAGTEAILAKAKSSTYCKRSHARLILWFISPSEWVGYFTVYQFYKEAFICSRMQKSEIWYKSAHHN